MKLNCKFDDIDYYSGETFYGCMISEQNIPEDEILDYDGQHQQGKSNDDIIEVCFYKCIVTKVPQGLLNVFPNMEILDFFDSKLENLRKMDLVQYKNLRRFLCPYNSIKFLPGNLFEGFEYLEWIRFCSNKLEVIEPNILNNLNKLTYVDFKNNPNYDKFYTTYSDAYEPNATLQEVKNQLFEKYIIESDQKIHALTEENQRLTKEIEHINNKSILNDIKKFIENENFKDFRIEIEDREFLVHKFLLAARSPTLAEMLQNNPDAENLKLVDIPVEVFQMILKFLYNDELPHENGTNFRHFFAAASRLKIEKLMNFATSKILVQINSENALEILDLGNKYGNNEIRQKAFEQIKSKHPKFDFKDEWALDTEKIEKMIGYFKKLEAVEKEFSSIMN